MALERTEGVVLRRMDLGEADRIVTLLTRRFGRIKAVAKGCRKPTSRLAGYLEPLSLCSFLLWKREGRDLSLVRSSDLLIPQDRLGTDLGAFAAAQVAAELADAGTPEGEPQPRLYDLLARFLEALGRPEHAFPALSAYALRACEALGYHLDPLVCAGCGNRMSAGEARLSYPGGGMLCPSCASRDAGAGEIVDASSMRALMAAAARPPRAVPAVQAAGAMRVLDRWLAWHQERRPLSSVALLEEVARAG